MNQQKRRSQFVLGRKPSTKEDRGGKPLGVTQVELNDADPPDSSAANWENLTRFAIAGIAFVVAIVALYLARSILMPVSAALLIGITLRPIQLHLARYRVPGPVTALALIAAFIGVTYFIVTLVAGSLADWIAQAPDLGSILREKLRWLDRPLETLRELQKSIGGATGETAPKVAVETSLPTVLQGAVTVLTPALSELLVFFGTLLFFLVGTEKLRRQLITLFETRDARLTVVRIWNDIEHNLVTYLGTVTVINAGLGVVTAAMLYVLGFPNPLAFGALAFVLNYAPYVGPALMIIMLSGVGLIAYPTLGGAVLPALLFFILTTLEGQFVTPGVVGRRLTLSPFLVFLALAFWTWLWGPLGTFMATPLLIVGLVALGHLFPRDDMVLPR